MSGRLFLFTGEEAYLIQEEVQRWQSAFASKYGEESVFVYKGDWDAVEVVSSLQGGGLFAQEKLIVVYGLPADGITSNKVKAHQSDAVFAALQSVDLSALTGTVIVFVSYKPDKRTSAYKWFKNNAELKEYKPLKGKALTRYVSEQVGDLMGADQIDHFVGLSGSDIGHIQHELDKLRCFLAVEQEKEPGKTLKVTRSLLDQLVFPRGEANNFAFLDAMFVDEQKALRRLVEVQKSGVHRVLFSGALYRGLKIMIQMTALYRRGKTTSSLLAKEISCPPFTVSRYLKFIDRFLEREVAMQDFFFQLVELDLSIKQGKMSDTAFFLQLKVMVSNFFQKH